MNKKLYRSVCDWEYGHAVTDTHHGYEDEAYCGWVSFRAVL